MYVQTTSDRTSGNFSARRQKMLTEPVLSRVRQCLATGNEVVLQTWRKTGKRGERKRWTVREHYFKLAELPPSPLPTAPALPL